MKNIIPKYLPAECRLYEYVLNITYELKLGNIIEDVFTKKRELVDNSLKDICPEAIKELVSIYDDMKSKNDVDWSKATLSCRSILKEVADKLYPASKNAIDVHSFTEDKYKNRLIQYIREKSTSETFNEIVGSQLEFISDRIENIYDASCKGKNRNVSLEDAERCIIYTYLIVGDILSL